MSQRKKEEERSERIIRSLLRLPENRRCINCNSLGPQYVCTTFWTIVCTNCSGIHREFTHRVKSVSMAKFNSEEVSALQACGNERAREIYFKAWDPQRHSYPDAGNLHKLRDFIKHVYVDRKYTGERGSDRLSMVKVGAEDNFYEHRSFERSSLGSIEDFYDGNSFERPSPSGRVDERNFRHYIDDRRSPSCKIENGRSGCRRSHPTASFEIVDDRFRDDEYGSVRRSESRRFSSSGSRAASMSPEPQKIREKASPPVLRPLKDVMGENSPTRRVMDPPKANNGKGADASAYAQQTASSSNPGSVDAMAVENKAVNTSSLIDFDNNAEVPDMAAEAQTETDSSVQSSTVEKTSDPPKVNSVESLLFELSVAPVGNVSEVPNSGDASSTTPVVSSNGVAATASSSTTNTPVVPNSEGTAASSPMGNAQAFPCSRADSMFQVNDRLQVQTMQQPQPSESPARDSNSTAQKGKFTFEALSDQPWPLSPAPNAQEQPSSASADQSSQAVSIPAQNTSSGDGSKSNGRKELPMDLFTFSYPSYPAPVQNWQFRPTRGMGYGMQYVPAAAAATTATAMPGSAYPNSAKSTNPFDLGNDSTQSQAAVFPSMASLHGAFPQMSPHAGVQPQPSRFASALPPQSPPYGMTTSPGVYMGLQLSNNMPNPRPQGNGSFDSDDAAFASLNPIQRSRAENSTPTAPNSFSPAGGNPFW